MNVNEQLLNTKIDPYLTDDVLSEVASRALGLEVSARFGRILTGGCWNRVISVPVESLSGGNGGVAGGPAGGSGATGGNGADDGNAATDGSGPAGGSGANGGRAGAGRGWEGGRPPDQLVFKISPREGDAGIEREFAVLEYFAENSGMPVPRPFLIETHGKTIPGTVLVMSRVPGSVLHSAHGTLTRRDRAAVNRQITEHVLNLHESKLNGFGGVELSREDRHERWSDFWLPRFDRVMKEARESGVIESAFFERVDALRPSFEHWLSSVTEATLTHYDIWSGNVMVDRRDGEAYVSGFIDIPGFAADYAREISFMLMFGMADESFLRAYADRHGLDEDFALRVNMYNLKMHTKHITMYPSQYYYRQGAESCLRYLEEKQNAPT